MPSPYAVGVLTDVAGIEVGHWTEPAARTGCTVVLLPPGTVASGEVRGGAPATHELGVLDPTSTVDHVDAVVLSGGSAFGLAACGGVLRWCEERGRGVETVAGRVPIVVGLSLFDLGVGDAAVRPGPAEGYAAAAGAAATGVVQSGPVGAGTGATVGKWRGRDRARPSGLGTASAVDGDLVVAALVAVNAWGEVVEPGDLPELPEGPLDVPLGREDTTIGVVATNARLDAVGCRVIARAGHAGMARVLHPVHTPFDGDALVAAATGTLDASPERVVALADRAVAGAVRAARPSAPG